MYTLSRQLDLLAMSKESNCCLLLLLHSTLIPMGSTYVLIYEISNGFLSHVGLMPTPSPRSKIQRFGG